MKWVVLILGEHMAISRVCLTLSLDCVRQRMQRCEMEASTRRGSILFILTANGECSIHIYSIPLYESYWIYRNCQKETKNCKLEKKGADNWFLFFYLKGSEGIEKDRMGIFLGVFTSYFLLLSLIPGSLLFFDFFLFALFIYTPSPPTDLPVSGWFPFLEFSFGHPFLMKRPAFRKFHEICVEFSPEYLFVLWKTRKIIYE